ncbi:MAG: hypothetical protein EZS28_001033 [Streblomastix strix]|uniref:Uncharacterized protein n=1 Tax=Streblomastix strix TaxID=222440 RepID=A0A5J4X871_9EUKA|nr:MAG: hypothetical protein EZS28_001033 [Streblomastix strix]
MLKFNEENDEGRMYLIRSGIVESLLQILTTRDLNSITLPFCSAFYCLTIFCSKWIRNQILIKKLQPALIRLLSHVDAEVVGNAITSIHNLITEGIEDTAEDEVNQHFDEIQRCDGIDKIYEIFTKNANKYTRDCCSVCIGYLYRAKEIKDSKMRSDIIQHLKLLTDDSDKQTRNGALFAINHLSWNPVNLSEILKGYLLIQIRNSLRKELSGNSEENKMVQTEQEHKCEVLTAILEDREDDELRQNILDIGIVDSLLFIIATREFNTIILPLLTAYLMMTDCCSNEFTIQCCRKNPFPALIRILDHPIDESIAGSALTAIHNIIHHVYDSRSPDETHKYYEAVLVCDGISKMYKLFCTTQVKEIKDSASICIGRLFKSKKIDDEQMRKSIISHLQTLRNDPDENTQMTAINALNFLSKNAANNAEIQMH